MATVYLARDRKHDRRVAIKVVNPDLSQTLGPDRFMRDIDIAAKLTHPHILPLHDSGDSGGTLFYVMPYVEGETLRHRLRRDRQLPLADALRIACDVASALDYAHRRDVLHRDIKPENILLEQGHAILADFGIARAIDAAAAATGMTLGTPMYMSPEQASAGILDGRSDLYSLACVLYEMLAGEPPFTGPTAQAVIAKRLSGSPPRIRTVRPSVPEHVEQVLLRALDPTPADRYATAAQFRDALSATSTATVPQERPRAPRPRRPVRAVAAAVLVLVGALAAGWSLTERAEVLPVMSLAVLPFESRNPEHAYLAEGLADALITDLVRAVPGIRVVSRMSVMRYSASMDDGAMAGMSGGLDFLSAPPSGRGSGAMAPRTLPEIARELRVDARLQGTVERDGDSIRVKASLVRPDPLQTIWEHHETRPMRDLFGLQRDLADAVAGAVTRRDAQPVARSGAARAQSQS